MTPQTRPRHQPRRDPNDISCLLDDDGWIFEASGDDWIVPAQTCGGIRITEIGERPFDALRLDAAAGIVHDFCLSGIIVDDHLVPGMPNTDPPGRQSFGTWVHVRRRRTDRPLILEIDNRSQESRRFSRGPPGEGRRPNLAGPHRLTKRRPASRGWGRRGASIRGTATPL